MLLFQTTTPETTTTTAPPGGTTVVLDPAQMQQLLEHAQGNTHYVSAWLAVMLICLGAMVMIMAIGGR